MIIEKGKREVLASGSTKQMLIKANGKAFKILASSLYKNIAMAILREYAQNCQSSHILSGNEQIPFEIELPTIFNPILRFTDYGQGMAPEFIEDNENGYLSCFSSSREDTNLVSSGYGIGRCAILGMVDSYIIKSYYNKKEYIYTLFISSSGSPELMKISEEKTTRCNGVIIEAAIPANEVANFAPHCQNIFQFFDTKPIITQGDNKIEVKPLGESKFKGKNWFIPDSNSGYFANSYKIPVIWSGCYGYQLDYSSIHDLTNNQCNLLKTGIVLKMPIGDISTNASRESVQLDEKTIKVIKDTLNNVLIDLFQNVENEIKAANSLIEAKKIWNKWNKSEEIYEIKSLFSSFKFTWNNINIDSNSIRIDPKYQLTNPCVGASYRAPNKLSNMTVGYIGCDDETVLIHDDVPDSERDKRLKTHFWEVTNQRFFKKHYTYCFKGDISEFLKTNLIEDIKVVKLSTLEKWKNPAPKSSSKTSKGSAKILKYNGSNYYSSDSWDLTETPKTGVYVNIDRYAPSPDYRTMKDTITLLGNFGITLEIYGVKAACKSHKLTYLSDYVKDFIEKIDIKSFNIEDKIWAELFNANDFIRSLKDIKTDGPAKELQDKYKSLDFTENNKLNSFVKLCNLFSIASNLDFEAKRAEITKKFDLMKTSFYDMYPMFNHVNPYERAWRKDFNKYIELTDNNLNLKK